MEDGETNKDVEVVPALIAVHPDQKSVAVAVGADLRVFDLHAGSAASFVDESGSPFHKDSIRDIRFGAKGKLFVSAGDDKIVKIWSAEFWRCICTVKEIWYPWNRSSEKRVTAVAISNDGSYVCFADKFGVVWVVDLTGYDGNQPLVNNKKATPLLSHYCSIITSLEFSPDGQFIISADRDFKIRVTVFPSNPVNGAHEIQNFCLGHTEFVSCLAFVRAQEYPHGHLISGSGDSTVRLWDILSGALLDTCEVATKAGLLESNGKSEKHGHAVTDLCTTLDGSLIAVAIQSLQGIILLKCNLATRTLSFSKLVSIVGEAFVPASLGNSSSTGILWMVTGASNLPGSSHPSLARIRAISGFDVEQEPTALEDDKIPGGEQLLETLQGSASVDDTVFLAAAEAVKTAMCNLLIKKQYPAENREYKKRTRNDKKFKL